jgi:hypothetical protein
LRVAGPDTASAATAYGLVSPAFSTAAASAAYSSDSLLVRPPTKNFSCSICDSQFVRKDSFASHMRQHKRAADEDSQNSLSVQTAAAVEVKGETSMVSVTASPPDAFGHHQLRTTFTDEQQQISHQPPLIQYVKTDPVMASAVLQSDFVSSGPSSVVTPTSMGVAPHHSSAAVMSFSPIKASNVYLCNIGGTNYSLHSDQPIIMDSNSAAPMQYVLQSASSSLHHQ